MTLKDGDPQYNDSTSEDKPHFFPKIEFDKDDLLNEDNSDREESDLMLFRIIRTERAKRLAAQKSQPKSEESQ